MKSETYVIILNQPSLTSTSCPHRMWKRAV